MLRLRAARLRLATRGTGSYEDPASPPSTSGEWEALERLMSQSIAETGNTQIITFILLQTYGTILSSSVKTKVVGRWWAMRLYCHLLGLGLPYGSSFWWYCLSWLLAFWYWCDMHSWWCSSSTCWTHSTTSPRCSPLMLSDRIAFLMIRNGPGTFLDEKGSS